jgi:hypothetical protein
LLHQKVLHCICKDPFGGFWVGGKGGVAYYNGSRFTSKYDVGEVYDIKIGEVNGRKDIWLGTIAGLQHLENGTWKIFDRSNSGLMDEEVLSVELQDDGSVWCGGNAGLHHFFPKRKYWEQYTGRHKVYRSGSLQFVPGNCGLPANQIYGLDWFKGQLWVATNGGVARLYNGHWTAYTADHKEFMLENEKQKMISVAGNSSLSGNWIDDVKYNPKRKEVYIATDKGVSIFIKTKDRVYGYKVDKNPIYHIENENYMLKVYGDELNIDRIFPIVYFLDTVLSKQDKEKSKTLMSDKISELYDTPKYILKKAYEDMIPYEVLYRKKMGFPVPLNNWFGGHFNDYAKEVLLNEVARKRGIYNVENIKKWLNSDRLSKDHGFAMKIWMLINIELFNIKYFDNKGEL